jgi:hypothetical protein
MALGLNKPIIAIVHGNNIPSLATYGLDHIQAVVWKRHVAHEEVQHFMYDTFARVAYVIFHAKGWQLLPTDDMKVLSPIPPEQTPEAY